MEIISETVAEDPTTVRCRVCSCPDLRPDFLLLEFTVLTCPQCGHGTTTYTQEITDSQSRFGEVRWTETRDILQPVVKMAARRRYEELLEFSPGRDILEVGCGTGEFLRHAHDAGHRVTGIDLSGEAVRYVREHHPGIDVRCQSLETAGLLPASFDVIAAFHVLEHVSDPIGLLSQMKRLLRPGGLVYVRVPNLNSWFRRVLGRNWWGFSVEHMSHFTDQSMRLALASAGLGMHSVWTGDSNREHSYWPVLPLLLARGAVLRSVGNALQPPPDPHHAADRSNARRIALKSNLLAA